MNNKAKFNISYIFADKPGEYNTSNFRCVMPAKALAKAGYGVSLIPIQLFQEHTDDVQKTLENAHVLVVERNYIGDVITRMVYWRMRMKVIIANFDDAYHCIEETNVSYPFWHDGVADIEIGGEKKRMNIFPHPFHQFELGLKVSHAMTLPSKHLMKYYSQYAPAYYVPNYFNTEHYIGIPKEKRNFVTIGWGGSVSHLQSFKNSGILAAIKNVCEVRDNVKIMICGDNRVLDAIPIPDYKKLFHPYVEYEKWGGVISRNFDIGVAPLAGEYDHYRSYIKPLEYMLTKTPFVATKGIAYKDIEEYGTFSENGEENWTKALLEKVDNLERENHLAAEKPYEFGLSKEVNLNTEEITDVYRMIANKHALLNFSNEETP